MNYSDSEEPQGPGRRALPADQDDGPVVVPRRGMGVDEQLPAPSRRGTTPDLPEEDDQPDERTWFRGAGGWVVLVATLIIGVALWGALRPSTETPQVNVPITTQTVTTPTPTPTASPASPSVAGTTTVPGTPDPSDSAPPLPATASAAPVPSAPAEPNPNGGATAGLVELNDARFTAPESWVMYGDDLIEDARRAVRLSNEATDARLQVVTLVPGGTELTESCGSLVDLQQTQFTDVTRQLVVPIGVDTASGEGVRCGFSGVRSSDGVANTVTFTLVSRASDSHVLMLRTTVPDDLPSDSPAIGQLNSMSCQASDSFGVTLPLC